MANNIYVTSPLYIAKVDPENGLYIHAFYFLGSVPKNVLDAAQRRKSNFKDSRKPEWSAFDANILKEFYGVHWKSLLTPEDPSEQENLDLSQQINMNFTGGASASDNDFGNLDDIDNIMDSKIIEETGGIFTSVVSTATVGPPTYTDISVYAEDTIFDLRLKLSIASKTPFYRQHFFYYINGEGPILPYKFTLDGVPVLVNWRALRIHNTTDLLLTSIAGLEIDPRLEERREGIHITALDTFTLLSAVPGIRLTKGYYIDLYDIIPPLGSPERPNDGLQLVLHDRFQFDLLYYGGIIKYWPQLSSDACNIALSDPLHFASIYFALDPDPDKLKAQFQAEKIVANRALEWHIQNAKNTLRKTSVTSATIKIVPEAVKMRVAIRNVFDLIATGVSIAAASVRFDMDANLLSEADGIKQGGFIPITVTKRHASSYGPRSALSINKFISKQHYNNAVVYAIARNGDGIGQQIPYTYVSIFFDGRIEASATWREDDHIGFEVVYDEIKTIINPIIELVNAMGSAAFPIGGKLHAGTDTSLTTFGNITVSTFWPHAISVSSFREIKNRFKFYEKAGIISIRGLQQGGAYIFTFRKGITTYDLKLADPTNTEPLVDLDKLRSLNQYSWLTDEGTADRWRSSFQGRIVKIYHRATDLQIEIDNADNLSEFELIKRYIFSFLDNLLTGEDKLQISSQVKDDSKQTTDSHRLRRLQERDPNLFDLKKYDNNATVYSVLCQSGRQPQVFKKSEVAKGESSKLTRYWNFTENESAYYKCPDPKYPHLSFISGYHQLGYCLPCCKKKSSAVGSRASLIKNSCLKNHTFITEDQEDESAMSRHVLAYGKEIQVGRISDIPIELKDGLFLNAVPQPYNLQLIGVEQSSPSVPDAGFAYALAYAIAIESDSIDKVLTELANLVIEMKDTYYALGNGGGAAFASARDLAAAIMNAFILRDPNMSPFGPGGFAVSIWRNILVELARYVYGVETVILADPTGTGSITIETSPESASSIIGKRGCVNVLEQTHVVLLSTSPNGTYPIAALNHKLYLRVPLANRWMVMRRTFSFDKTNTDIIADDVAEFIRDALVANSAPIALLDLNLIIRYSCSGKFKIKTRLINMHNLCYGVILQEISSTAVVYIPVQNSVYDSADGLPILFEPRPLMVLSSVLLAAAIADINLFIGNEKEPLLPISKQFIIINVDGLAIGFGSTAVDPLYFFHDATEITDSDILIPTIQFPYDCREIDLAISKRQISTVSNPLAISAAVRNRLYRLFIAEFSSILRAERNIQMRDKLINILAETVYDSAESLSNLRRKLISLLKQYPDDLQAVRDAISRSYIISPHNPSKSAIDAINASHFTFDLQTIIKLRAMQSHDEVTSAIKILMSDHVVESEMAPVKLTNIFVSCVEKTSVLMDSVCVNHKLAVPADRLNDFYQILAADVRNPGKTDIITAISSGVFNYLDFIYRVGEHINIIM